MLVGGKDGKLYEFSAGSVTQPQIVAALNTGAIVTRAYVAPDRTLFVATDGGVLYRLSETGSILWKLHDASGKWLEPTASDTMVYTATVDGLVRAYPLSEKSTPKAAWQLSLGRPLQGHPTFLHGLLYLGTAAEKGTLFALDAR